MKKKIRIKKIHQFFFNQNKKKQKKRLKSKQEAT